MFCQKCGTQLQDDALFCLKCGTPVAGVAPVQVTSKPFPRFLIFLIIVVASLPFLGIFAAILIPNIFRASEKAHFNKCEQALSSVKVAEEMYISDKNKYTAYPDELAMYMIPGCSKADGSDCKGKVSRKIDRACKAGSLIINTSPDGLGYNVKGMADTHMSCAICISTLGTTPAAYTQCVPYYACM
jgi:hypothetical protein